MPIRALDRAIIVSSRYTGNSRGYRQSPLTPTSLPVPESGRYWLFRAHLRPRAHEVERIAPLHLPYQFRTLHLDIIDTLGVYLQHPDKKTHGFSRGMNRRSLYRREGLYEYDGGSQGIA